MPVLDWSLVIATSNRPAALRRCVEHALRQTRPPREVVIVDASDDWTASRDALAAEVAARHPAVAWHHLAARERSLPAQRNQAIDRSSADVLFLIDDDSVMFPDCAARVMDVYEADRGGAVAGVSPAMAYRAPGRDPAPAAGGVEDGDDDARQALPSALNVRGRLAGHVAGLFDIERLLMPYDADYPSHPVPPGLDLSRLNATPARYFHGMRMTFRRDVIRAVRFDEMLRGYAAAEDLDASYRASRHGLLLTALGALLYHAQDPAGRLTRYARTLMGLVNLAALYRIKSGDAPANLAELRRRVVRRAGLDLLRDLGRGRLSVPSARADVYAIRKLDVIRRTPVAELRSWLGAFQRDLTTRNPN